MANPSFDVWHGSISLYSATKSERTVHLQELLVITGIQKMPTLFIRVGPFSFPHKPFGIRGSEPRRRAPRGPQGLAGGAEAGRSPPGEQRAQEPGGDGAGTGRDQMGWDQTSPAPPPLLTGGDAATAPPRPAPPRMRT